VVTLDLVTSAKLALAAEMARQGISNVALAERLGVSEKVVRRLLDPDHRCRIDRLEIALAVLGRQVGLVVARASRVA
jgi:antitoxin HicB